VWGIDFRRLRYSRGCEHCAAWLLWRSCVWHRHVTSRTVDGYDIGKNKNDGHTNITSLKEGGLGAQFFAVYVSSSFINGNRSAHRGFFVGIELSRE
jgi:hypothetical protein